MLSPLHNSMNQELFFKSTSAIKAATMKNTDNFHYEEKPSRATDNLTPFAASKEEWDTKEDTGKSMKNAL